MKLRRALLLFAMVLGLAALASSLSRPDEDRDEPGPSEGPADRVREPGSGPATVRFAAGRRREVRRLEAGSAATVLVEVSDPGQVRIEGLGLTQPAEPLTPARFDVLLAQPGSSRVVAEPAGGGPREVVGTLVVRDTR